MFEVYGTADHEAIMRRAHQMRAEVLSQIVRSLVAPFRRKSAGSTVKA